MTVRNPFDLVATWYQMHKSIGTLEFFLKNFVHSHFVRDGKLFWLKPEHYDGLIRYEHLERDLHNLAEMYGIEEGPFEILNATAGKLADYREYYDANTISLMNHYFGPECQEFGYAFE